MISPTDSPVNVVVVDDDREMRQSLVRFLERSGYRVVAFPRAEHALDALASVLTDVVVSDVRMPGMSGLELLNRLEHAAHAPPIVLITAHGDVPMAVDAMKAGAFDFVEKPFQPNRLLDAVRRAAAYGRLKSENAALKEHLRKLSGLDSILIGDSVAMRRLREEVEDAVQSEAPVLILGETGTGKELVARALHNLGPRAGRPFVPINCATIPRGEFEAFSPAHPSGMLGVIAEAEGGTLFLDELALCVSQVQAKLLRVIEHGTMPPVPDQKSQGNNVRIVSASNRKLEDEVDAGAFRQDLYYRLSAIILSIPSLRERGNDTVLLYEHFVEHYAGLYEVDAPTLTNDDIAALMSYDWPGNVRELRHVAERRILAWRRERGSASEAIRREGVIDDVPATLREAVAAFERQLISREIRIHEGRMEAVARTLGIARRTLNDRIVKLGIRKQDLL